MMPYTAPADIEARRSRALVVGAAALLSALSGSS
jgi:hypothetical protein